MSEKMSPQLTERVQKIAEGPEPKYEERMLSMYESAIQHDPKMAELFVEREALMKRMGTPAWITADAKELDRVNENIAICYRDLMSVAKAKKAA